MEHRKSRKNTENLKEHMENSLRHMQLKWSTGKAGKTVNVNGSIRKYRIRIGNLNETHGNREITKNLLPDI